MEIKFEKLLKSYCGERIFREINEWGEYIYKINGAKKALVLNYWKFYTKISEIEKIMNNLIKIFDIIYNHTDKIKSGNIIDFDFNAVLVYYEKIENSYITVKKIITRLDEVIGKDFFYATSLHFGNVIIGNWGSNYRFKQMLIGNEVDFCKFMVDVSFEKEINCIISESYKIEKGGMLNIQEIGRYGTIGVKNTNLYKLEL